MAIIERGSCIGLLVRTGTGRIFLRNGRLVTTIDTANLPARVTYRRYTLVNGILVLRTFTVLATQVRRITL